MEAMASNDVRIQNVLGRLEMILDNENSRIGIDPEFDIKTSNAHKSRCLYELTMLHRDMLPGENSSAFSSHALHLREKLSVNSQKVEAHLEAVRAVVDLLKTAAQDADADGIYSEAQFRYSVF